MRLRHGIGLACILGVIACLAVLHEHGFAHMLGVDTQASQEYDFVSGVGPMLLTALGMTTIVSGLWHAHNCHAEGCWRIGRHRIKGTPWCNRHHEQARADQSLEDKLDRLITLLTDLGEKADLRLVAQVENPELR